MSFLSKLFGTQSSGKETQQNLPSSREILQDLENIKLKFSELRRLHTRQGSVNMFGRSPDTIGIICTVCDDAIKALNVGIGVEGLPINKAQISDGLKRLVRDAKSDTGVVATKLDVEGVRFYNQYLDELERIAQQIHVV
jgi:hypothetical protein